MAQKVVPQPLIANDPATDAPAVKSDKGADAGSATKPANSEAGLDLRSTVGHAAPLREQTHTADASSALPKGVVTMSDAAPSAATIQPASDTPAAEVKSTEAEDKPGDAKVEAKSETKSDELNTEAPTAAIANTEPAKTEPTKAEAPKVEEAKPSETKATESKSAEKPTEPVKAVGAPPADAKKDPARLPGAEKAAKAEAPRRPGQIAVFVSRKDSKLYVRENFKPQFDVPITIASSDRPLGTHVFTAEADKKDPNLLRWSVISLPVTARNAARTEEDSRTAGRRKIAAPAEAKPSPVPNSPAEALDRITVAPEAMARIAEVLATGGSIIVSDLGVNQGGETGEGTDFIVPLR